MEAREVARENWRNSGLAYSDIDKKDIEKLKELIKYELQTYLPTTKYSRSMDMRLGKGSKLWKNKYKKDGSIEYIFIGIDGSYFENREGVAFNQDGFIGFCGWADGSNKIPITTAFNNWVEIMRDKKLSDVNALNSVGGQDA